MKFLLVHIQLELPQHDQFCPYIPVHMFGFSKSPPVYPTWVDFTPDVLLNISSTCQKHPAANVAFFHNLSEI